MKNLFKLFVVFFSLTISYAQEHDYIPFVGEDKYWIYSQNDDWEPNSRQIGAFIFTIGTDTLINGLSYSKLIKHTLSGESPCSGYPCFTPYFPYQINSNHRQAYAYLREDTLTKKVYCLPGFESYQFCDSSEHVLYDFDQKIGDTLSLCNQEIIGGGIDRGRYFIVDSIKVEMLYGRQRKVWYFQGFGFAGGGLPNITTLMLIEGVGLVNNLGFYNDYTAYFADYCEGPLEQCNIVSGTKEIWKSSRGNVVISPNPCLEFFTIQSNFEISKVEIFDQNGKVVLISADKTIDTSSLFSSFYYVKMITNDNVSYYTKLIKI